MAGNMHMCRTRARPEGDSEEPPIPVRTDVDCPNDCSHGKPHLLHTPDCHAKGTFAGCWCVRMEVADE